MDKHIYVSAPGKLMLFGEHAVVYGYPCIVTAVDMRLYAQVETVDNLEYQIIAPQVNETHFVDKIFQLFKEKYHVRRGVRITTYGDISNHGGLGSSSAVTVAVCKALGALFSINMTHKELFELCYQVVLSVQKIGSGFDIAAAIYGHTIYFVTGGKIIRPMSLNTIPLVIGYSGVKANTSMIVHNIAKQYKKNNKKYESIFKKIRDVVIQGERNLLDHNYFKVGKLMKENHALLQELGVSTPKLDEMVRAAIEGGAYGAKLSGAGGGDCIIALVDERYRSSVERALVSVGGSIIKAQANVEGVRIEQEKYAKR